MNFVIHGREPASLFRFLEEISAIPRPSYHEGKIADYLVDFAKARGLEYHRDDADNVLIKKKATAGKEGLPAILFQGHTDMVCEKNSNVVHDFLEDPLKLYVEGKMLRAKGTTLGADDGIAVAMMLAMLDGELKEHPALECLFTTGEEVGLCGAHRFDYSLLGAERMVNLDSEEIGVVTAGCAGGLRSDLTLDCRVQPFAGQAIRVSITGLAGGHSGENINDGRANANRIMGQLLSALINTQEAYLISLWGGSKDNAIPRECEAILAVSDMDAAMDLLTDAAAETANRLSPKDRGFCLTVDVAEPTAVMFDKTCSEKLIALLSTVPNGVLAMSRQVEGLVEFSRNLGVIKTEGDAVTLVFSTRSALEEQLNASVSELDTLADRMGASVRHHSRYPGWSYAEVSPLRNAYLEAYREVTGQDARVNVIHAGLECGVIASGVPDMDIISIGPDILDIHSPDEALDLDSVEILWKTLERLIEK